jgi:hypothetical protein
MALGADEGRTGQDLEFRKGLAQRGAKPGPGCGIAHPKAPGRGR